MKTTTLFTTISVAFGCCSIPALAWAQGVATDSQLLPMVAIAGSRPGLPPDVPGSTASKTADELRSQNLFNPEDALQYLPSTTIRKRYIGDRNGLVGGRTFGVAQPARALVYLDSYLISNFLGRFDAPRWNMLSPEAIARVDVLYGPFSALYPGNSIGTTMIVTQRVPKGVEVSARASGHSERFDQYGQSERFGGKQLSLRLANRFASGVWLSADVNHQNSTSHPMQYFTATANAAANFPVTSAAATPVSGIMYDTDPKGFRRAAFGASAGAVDHTVQDTLNLRGGYRAAPALEASAMASWWRNDTLNTNRPWVRDSAGMLVWSGTVTDGVNAFDIPLAAFAPSTRNELHQQLGVTLKTRHERGWNGSVVVSDYRILKDQARQSANPEPVAAAGGSGSVTRRDGTGWNTFEVQATWTPSAGDWTGGDHKLSFGLHRNAYQLDNTVANMADWRSGADQTVSQSYRGKTEVFALYAQDAWRLRDDLKLTLGMREELFRTTDGSQLGAGKSIAYPDRRLRGHSPKAMLSWDSGDALLLKASFGRGVRFPNVEELYNGTVTAASQTLSDPRLKPEISNAIDLTAEKEWHSHFLRASLFYDDGRDTILRQTDATVVPSRTYVSNVDKVETRGIELAWTAHGWPVRTLSVDASATFTDSTIAANAKDPRSVGKYWLRMPRTRARMLLTWRPSATWMASIGLRHEGETYGDMYNLDTNQNVFGGGSAVNQADLRASYMISQQLEFALGLNNATDQRAFAFHPYPGRTLFAELRFAR